MANFCNEYKNKRKMVNSLKYSFISLSKAQYLEDIIGFLSNIKPSQEEITVVTNSQNPEDWNIEMTNLLQELQILNLKREEILNKFKKKQ